MKNEILNDAPYFVVGIGASAGGLEAISEFFKNIPSGTRMAFVIIQHLSPDFKSMMKELLGKHTKIPISTVSRKTRLKPDHIYLNPRNKNLLCHEDLLILEDKPSKHKLNLPIDQFFHSLGTSFKERAISIILSGTGTDGSRGIKSIKESGGTIMVQEPSSAQFDGMPNAAIRTQFAEIIGTPVSLAKTLLKLSKRIKLDVNEDLTIETDVFQDILKLLLKAKGVDFSKYKQSTIFRRIHKRKELAQLNSDHEYLDILKTDPNEISLLFQDLLIGVTSFFRDTDAFLALRTLAFPFLMENTLKSDTLRIWCAGCSTGEEAYSLAIVLDEFMQEKSIAKDFKIFATDVDQEALEIASRGLYPVNILSDISTDRIKKYFVRSGDKYKIIKRIREKIIFSNHDLLKDPPFIRIDMITCRNLLIYLNPDTQQKVYINFQFSLVNQGILFLGTSESLGSRQSYFKTLEPKWKIYLCKEVPDKDYTSSRDLDKGRHDRLYNPEKRLTHPKPASREDKFTTVLIRQFANQSLFIDEEFNILYTSGDISNLLRFSIGDFSRNLSKMTEPGSMAIIRNGVRKLKKEGEKLILTKVPWKIADNHSLLDIHFQKFIIDSHPVYLIRFLERDYTDKEFTEFVDEEGKNIENQRISDLEAELKESRFDLQNAIEELETSNEELQSSNEELIAANEELQSTNEELQSVNEELYTVNTELQIKNKELEDLNNDMINLMNVSQIGSLFLDGNLDIRKFTPAVSQVLNLEEGDIGRSIKDFASNFKDLTGKDLYNHTLEVIKTSKTREVVILSESGRYYLKKIIPFKKPGNKIEGAVINFFEVTELVKSKSKLDILSERLHLALSTGNLAWWETDLDSAKVDFSDQLGILLGYNPGEIEFNNKTFNAILHPDDLEDYTLKFKELISGSSQDYLNEYRLRTKSGEYHWFLDKGKIIAPEGQDKSRRASGVLLDINERKRSELELLHAKIESEKANKYKDNFLSNISHEIRTPMNGIVGFADLLKKDNLPKDKKEQYLDIIVNNAGTLLRLIDEIVDLSQLNARYIVPDVVSFSLNELLYELYTRYKQRLKTYNKQSISLSLNIPDKDRIIKSDPLRLTQILDNLMDNAIKFTDKGEIEINYRKTSNKLEFMVSDTGIGIQPDDLNRIFNHFQQLTEEVTLESRGTGLGLSIVKGLVGILGGKVWVNSTPGEGSSFHFTLDYVPGEVHQSNNHESIFNSVKEKLNGKIVLVAEDEDSNARLMFELLNFPGIKIVHAWDGKQALQLFRDHEPHLILMDIKMPEMDGISALREIRKNNPSVPVIAQTAYAMKEEVVRNLASGFTDYITKPIDPKDLYAKIDQHFTR